MIRDARNEVTNPDGNRPQDIGRVLGIAVHHSVTDPNGPALADEDATEVQEREHIRAIDRYHVSIDYGGFAYHYAVFPTGRAYKTGEGQRAHVEKRNHELRGVVLIGDFSTRGPTPAALDGLREVLLAEAFLPPAIKGHREWTLPGTGGTVCPGTVIPRDWAAFLEPPRPARYFLAGDYQGGIEKAGNQLIIWNNGVPGNAIGDWAGQFPGSMHHLSGKVWEEKWR